MPQFNRNFYGAVLSRPSNAVAPLSPSLPRSMPTPANTVNQSAIDAKYNDLKSARANQAFNQWYGELSPEQAGQFHQAASDTPNTLSINGVSGVTDRSEDELSALARQKAREHFTANVLPSDTEYNQLDVQHAIERHGGVVGGNGAVAPLNPNIRTSTKARNPDGSITTTTQMPEKPPVVPKVTDPSVVAVNNAKTNLLNQQTTNAVAATQPGGKDYKDPALNESKIGLNDARAGAVTKNADTAAEKAAAAENKITPAQLQALTQDNESIRQRLGEIDKQITAYMGLKNPPYDAIEKLNNERTGLFTRHNANTKAMAEASKGPKPADLPGSPASTQAAPVSQTGSTVLPGPPSTSTQPRGPLGTPLNLTGQPTIGSSLTKPATQPASSPALTAFPNFRTPDETSLPGVAKVPPKGTKLDPKQHADVIAAIKKLAGNDPDGSKATAIAKELELIP